LFSRISLIVWKGVRYRISTEIENPVQNMTRTPHDPAALAEAVIVARAVARQLGEQVCIQQTRRVKVGYTVRLGAEATTGRERRNCYRISPSGEVVAFAGNPPLEG
jgi:hypothetical protein